MINLILSLETKEMIKEFNSRSLMLDGSLSTLKKVGQKREELIKAGDEKAAEELRDLLERSGYVVIDTQHNSFIRRKEF